MMLLGAQFLFLFYLHQTSAYDYVVVGGGTAGLTVANRLSEDPSVSVAVIEAGPNAENLPEVFIPGLVGTGQSFTTLNWAYPTVPQAHLNNRILTVNAGRALGGSTVINSMISHRAQKEQYDAWGILNNDSTWTWNSLLPYFKKSEHFTPPNEFQTSVGGVRFDSAVHGFDGPVKVGFPNFFYPQATLWRTASMGLGFPPSPDLTNGEPHGVGVAPSTLDASNNTRCSAACAYYSPFSSRPNLSLFTNSTVTRILWSNSSSITASGVEFRDANGQVTNITVEREVILSSGTIGSPKVLELSGVGNATILTAAGVKTVLRHPTVGENLADHIHSWANAFTNISLTRDALLLNPAFNEEQLSLWFANRTGLLSTGPCSLGTAEPSQVLNEDQLAKSLSEAEKNIQHFANLYSNGNPDLARGIEAQHRIALDLYRKDKAAPLEMILGPGYSGPTPFSDRPRRNYTSINTVFYAPLSRGRTHISSSDPDSPPAVDPAYWAHPLDVAVHVGGIKLARKMLVTPPLEEIFVGEFEPGANRTTDEDTENWLRGVITSDNHEVGTMAMLPKELGGVVDTSLKVYGTSNVRVADASIIPFPISTHLMSTVYMIGERAADIIKSGTAEFNSRGS